MQALWLLLLELALLGVVCLLGGVIHALHRSVKNNTGDIRDLATNRVPRSEVASLETKLHAELVDARKENRKDHRQFFETLKKINQRLAKINGEVV